MEYQFHSKFDGIIGNNILVNLNSVIDYKNRRLVTEKASIPIYLNKDEEEYSSNCYKDNSIEVFSSESNENIPSEKNFANHLNKNDLSKLRSLLNTYKDIFYKDNESFLSFTDEVKHRIITKNDIPIFSKLYRYPEIHQKEVDKQIEGMLQQGIIVPSNSPYNSPIWVVPKKIDNSGEQKWRIVVDYRKLNDQTISDRFPIPNIDDLFDKLGKCNYFTTLDLAKGFHQIEVDPRDRMKTAFSTTNGHYEFTRMPFGLKNAPATFQRLINHVLKDLINKICVVYLDDILIFSTSLQEHLNSLQEVFQKLRESNLQIQIDKCHFAEEFTNYLGHVITNNGIKPDDKKVTAIKSMKLPSSPKEIKQFLGITGYYRKFVKDYAKVAYPMIKYLKGNTKVNIKDDEYINAFNKLKKLLTSDPILKRPDFTKKFTLTTDASNYAIGAVLSQDNHPICFASRTLNDHEKRYATIEKELLAIVWSVKYFRTYLYGRTFNICTDHKPLVWLHNIKEPNMKLQRWKIMLNEYDFNISYLRGKENHVADGLSRYINRDDDEVISLNTLWDKKIILNNELNNDNASNSSMDVEFMTTRNENFDNSSVDGEVMSTADTVRSGINDSTDHIYITEKCVNIYKNQIYLNYGEQEKFRTKIIHRKCQNHITVSRDSNLLDLMKKTLIDKGIMCIHCENDELFVKFQNLYVKYFSSNRSLKVYKSNIKLTDITDKNEILTIIKEEHLKNNHRGIKETFNEIKLLYFYPDMLKLITKVINNCEICQLAKFDRQPYKIPYQISETAKEINDIVHMDIWFPYRNVMYLTTIDKFSKYATYHKLNDRTWVSILEALKERIRFLGKMKKLVFDNERCMLHNAVELFLNENQIKIHRTTAGNKTGNADVERLHGTLNEHLRIMAVDKSNDSEDIDEKMDKIIGIYNNTIHSTTKMRPMDFITKHFDKTEIKELSEKFEKEKTARISKLNEKRNNNYRLNENIVSNREIAKNKPKYKKLTNFRIDNNYVIDTNNKRNTKYSKNQLKRKFKYQK